MSQTTGRRQLKLRPTALRVTVGDETGDGLELADGLPVGDEEAARLGLTETRAVGVTAATGVPDGAQAASMRRNTPTALAFTVWR
jgi:hypothetical protein